MCQVLNCANLIGTGNHLGNLKSHIKNFHKEQYILIMNEKKIRIMVEIVQRLRLV